MIRRHTMFALALASLSGGAFVGACGQGGGGTGIVGQPTANTGFGPQPFPPPSASASPGPRPLYGTTLTQEKVPPPISGGTLLVTADGLKAFAADPDRDQAYIVDLGTRAVTTIPLQPGDEPGRAIEDASHRVHVILRSGGGIATIDLATAAVVGRTPVCAIPRGVAYDAASDSLFVACKSGELVVLPAAGGAPTRTVMVDRDLRDVVIDGNTVFVSQFRTANVFVFDKTLTPQSSVIPPVSEEGADPTVAWRMTPRPGGGVVMIHQRGQGTAAPPISTAPGGYSQGGNGGNGGSCDRAIVESAISSFGENRGMLTSPALSDGVLAVDVAVSPVGQGVAVIAAGNAHTAELPQLLVFDSIEAAIPPGTGGTGGTGGIGGSGGCIFTQSVPQPKGEATAVAFTRTGDTIVQTREPASLFIITGGAPLQTIPLSRISREDTGHAIFHANSGGHIACASCHAEGQDDSRVWTFDNLGPRRTPSLLGTVEGTAPYHWGGEERDFTLLVHDVFTGRMSGAPLEGDQLAAASRWVNALPAPPAPATVDAAAAARGQALFTGQAGCTGCHVGAKHTNNLTLDVGTGGAFQVPPLVGVGYRAPFLHMGCAGTLRDRFNCGGSAHGNTAGLSEAQLQDLIAFLNTL